MADPTPSPGAPADVELSGRELGNYRLLRRLGRGGMADVYLAEQLSLKRQVALKILKPSLAADQTYIRRFNNEAQAAASLLHANIVQIYEVGCIEGFHFIAQEYVAGQNLKQYLARRGSLDARQASRILLQCAAALADAAEKGIVHRDIKPENIMLSAKGEVKVADFGLARMAGESVNLTQVGMTMGTPLYMSPEQVQGGSLDHRSDLYSLGVTAYQMLAGRPPFEGETALAVAVQHLQREPRPLVELRSDLPPALCRIVHRLLAKAPADRFSAAADLIRELRTLPIPGGADPPSGAFDAPDALEGAAATGGHFDATQKLSLLMKSSAPPAKGPRWWMIVLGALAAWIVGSIAARAMRPPGLLTVPADKLPQIERLETASAQYYLAVQLNTRRAYEAVWEYFPKDENYRLRAKQRLAEMLLTQDDLHAAEKVFDELVALDAVQEQFRLVGYAGKAIVAFREENPTQAAEYLARLKDKESQLEKAAPYWIDEIRRIDRLTTEKLRKTKGG